MSQKMITIYDKNGNGLEIREAHKKAYIGKGYTLKKPSSKGVENG